MVINFHLRVEIVDIDGGRSRVDVEDTLLTTICVQTILVVVGEEAVEVDTVGMDS